MPVVGPLTYRLGSTSNLLWVSLAEAKKPRYAMTGLTYHAAGASVAVVRESPLPTIPVPLRLAQLGRYTPGGFIEADAAALPGVYEFGVPDEVLAAGSSQAVIVFRFPGAVQAAVRIDLVAHDPWDPGTVGIAGLGDSRRHAFLREAMPGATEARLLDGNQLERRLTELLATSEEWGGGRWSGSVP